MDSRAKYRFWSETENHLCYCCIAILPAVFGNKGTGRQRRWWDTCSQGKHCQVGKYPQPGGQYDHSIDNAQEGAIARVIFDFRQKHILGPDSVSVFFFVFTRLVMCDGFGAAMRFKIQLCFFLRFCLFCTCSLSRRKRMLNFNILMRYGLYITLKFKVGCLTWV